MVKKLESTMRLQGVLTKVLFPEETEEAQGINEQFITEYQPKNLTEKLLIETVTVSYIRKKEPCLNTQKRTTENIWNMF